MAFLDICVDRLSAEVGDEVDTGSRAEIDTEVGTVDCLSGVL